MNVFEDLVPGSSANVFEDLVPPAAPDPFAAMSARVGAMQPSYGSDPAPSAPLDTPNAFADLIPPPSGTIGDLPGSFSSGVMPSLTQALGEHDPSGLTRGGSVGMEDPRSWLFAPGQSEGQYPALDLGDFSRDPSALDPHWTSVMSGERAALRSVGAGGPMPGDFWDKAGFAASSGLSMLEQGTLSTGAQFTARTLEAMNRIDAGQPVADADDPMGYAYMTPEQRRAARLQVEQSLGDSAFRLRGLSHELADTPMPAALNRMAQAGTWGEAFDAFMEDPFGIIGFAGTQSMVATAPGIVLGAAGRAAAGLRGLMAGQGAGSAGVEFGAGIIEAIGEAGVDVGDSRALAAALTDQRLMSEIRHRAAIKAGAVGGFDAASAGLAGVAMRPIGLESSRMGALVEIPPQLGVQAAAGMAGEAVGSVLSGQEIKPGEVLLEGVAEAFTTPLDIVLARGGRGASDPAAAQATPGGAVAGVSGESAFERADPRLDMTRTLPDGAIQLPEISVTAPDPGGEGPAFATAMPPEVVQPVGPETLSPAPAVDEVAPIPGEVVQSDPVDLIPPSVDAVPPAVVTGSPIATPEVGQRVTVDFGDGETETGTVERVTPFDEDGQQRFTFLLRTDDGRGIDTRDDDVTITAEGPTNAPVDPLTLDQPVSPIAPPAGAVPPPAAEAAPDGGVLPPGGDVRGPGAVLAPMGGDRGAAPSGDPGGTGAPTPIGDDPAPGPVPGASTAPGPAPAAGLAPVAPGPDPAAAVEPPADAAPAEVPAPAPAPAPDAVASEAPGAGAVPQAVPAEAPRPGDGVAAGPPLNATPSTTAPQAPAPETGRDTGETVSAPAPAVDQAANFRGRLSAGSAINHTNGRRYFVVRLENGRYRAAYREEGTVGPTILADAKTRDEALDAAVADAFPTAANAPPPPVKTEGAPPGEADRSAQQRRPGETIAAYQRRLGVEPGSPEGDAAAAEWRRQFRAQQEANRQRLAAVDALPAPLEGEAFPDYANRNGWRPGSPEYDNGLRRWSRARDEANASRNRDKKSEQDAEAKRDRDRWIGIVHSWMERASDGDILSLPDAIETEAPLVLRVTADTAPDGSPRTTRRLVRVMSDGEEVLVAQSINGTFRGGPGEDSLPMYGKALEKSASTAPAPEAPPPAPPAAPPAPANERAGTRMSDPPTSRDHIIRQINRNGRSVPDASGRFYRVTKQDGLWRMSRHRPGERSGVTIGDLHPTKESATAAAADDWAAAAAMDGRKAAAHPSASTTAASPESVNQTERPAETGGPDGTEQLRPEVSRAPEGDAPGDVPAPAGDRPAGPAPERNRDAGAGAARPTGRAAPGEEPAAPGEGGVDGADAVRGVVEPDRPGDRAERDDPAPERGGRAEPDAVPADDGERRAGDRVDRDAADGVVGTNFQIPEGDEVASGGEKTRARQNIAAIRLLREIEASGRPATREQQRVLSKFVGWGGIPQIFRDSKGAFRKGWEALGEELESLLSAEELADARRSTINAHYTSGEVIRAMWRAAVDMGFAGGRVLEPSMGVGHFFGMMPPEIAGRSTLAGVELDRITGGIAKALYPQASVQVQGFQAVEYPADFFDVVIGNVPFSGTIKPHDPVHNKGGKLLLHDYFFAKSLAVTRPGGLLMLITSKGTMDKQDASFRRQLAASADLLGAIRLPNTAFKGNAGTEVTTDLLILRKRAPGTPAIERPWFDLAAVPPDNLSVNEYFARHPEQMLGTMRAAGSMYRADEATLVPDTSTPLPEQLARALRAISGSVTPAPTPAEQAATAAQPVQTAAAAEFAPSNLQDGAFYLNDDGEIRQRVKGVGVAVTVPKSAVPRIKSLIAVRDAARRVLDVQRADGSDADNKAAQRVLNDAYDAFVRKYGPINRTRKSERPHQTKPGEVIVQRRQPNLADFTDDPNVGLVRALEIYDEDTDTARKADIFTKRVLDPKRDIREVRTPTDALLASITDRGRIDLPWMAERLGTDEASVLAGLEGVLFRDPDTRSYVEAEDYLSGNVRKKLAIAQAAAAADPAFEANVRALEQVQPEDLPPSKIYASLGASWISPDVIAQFSKDVLGVTVRVRNIGIDASWTVEAAGEWSEQYGAANTVEYGTHEWSAVQLLEAGLNQKSPKVWTGGEKPTIDPERTAAVQEKLSRIREAFNTWMWEDPDRSDAQARIYNDLMNNTRLRSYDGSHLTFPGMSATVELRRHQKDAVWRALRSGNTLFAHVVGAGKTMAMIAHVMEARRTGLIRKPMIVVPNHMLEQFSREFLQLYPGANIMVADKEQFHGDKRRAFVARVATNDWDAVVITHSAFGMIGMSSEYQAEFLRNEIEAYKQVLIEAGGNKAQRKGSRDSQTVKRIEGQIAAMEERMRKLLAAENKDRGLAFEDLGVDHLTVDEAHFAKSLQIVTKMERIRGLSTTVSQRATDLFLKSRYLDGLNPGRSLVFATATPITNTLSEMFTMQRYMQYPLLQERGLAAFDAWAATFGETITTIDVKPAGAGFEQVTKFASFKNVPELLTMFLSFADIKTADMLGLPTPTLRTGSAQVVAVPPSPAQREAVQALLGRLQALKSGGRGAQKGGDNVLVVTTDGRKVATDIRLLDPSLPDAGGTKIDRAVDRIFDIWQRGTPTKRTQIVFSDFGTPGKGKEFDVYGDIRRKLVERGVPAKEIAFIHDANTDAKKARLFADVRSGKVRVLIGSTEKMGVGTNVQTRLIAMHHIDAPWRPADVEQRDGRIMRQGNENPEVEIYRYVTEGTFDAYMWQTLETKARFIAQIMRGDLSQREAEDVGEVTLDYATAKAIASGNPLVARSVALDAQIARLTRLASAHRDEQASLRARVRNTTAAIPANRELVEKLDSDIKAAAPLLKAKTVSSGRVGNSAYSDEKAFGEALLAAALPKEGIRPSNGEVVGRIGSFDIVAGPLHNRFPDETRDFFLRGDGQHPFVVERINGQALVNRMTAALARMEKRKEQVVEQIAADEKRLRDMEAKIGQPFRQAEELEKALADMADLRRQIREQEAAEAAAAAAARAPSTAPAPAPADDEPMAAPLVSGRETADAINNLDGSNELVRAESPGGGGIAVHPIRPEYEAELAAWEAPLQAIVDRILGPDRVELRGAQQLYGRPEPEGRAGGLYFRTQNLIYVATTLDDPDRIARHEAMHAAWTLGLFTGDEKAAMVRALERDPAWQRVAADIQATPLYRTMAESDLVEETAAHMWEAYRQGRPTGIAIVDRAFQRLAQLLDAVRAFVRAKLGFAPDWRDLFQAIERGALADRPAATLASEMLDAAAEFTDDPRGAVARDRADVERQVMAAALPDGISVEEKRGEADMNVFQRYIMRPLEAFARWPALQRLIRQGIDAEQRMSSQINRLNKRLDGITAKLTAKEFEEYGAILFQGDADETTYTRSDLAANGASPKVIDAYLKTRDLIETIGRLVDQHRRSMLPQVQERKAAVLRRMARLTSMGDADFRRLYGRRARLRSKLRAGTGDPETIARELDQIEEALTKIREGLPEYMELQAEADRLEARLEATSVRRREGYVPHKFFGSWRVFVRSGVDQDGNAVWSPVAGPHGFFPGRHAAIGAARLYQQANPGAELRVAPVEFKFPESDATQLSDRAYARFVGRVAEGLSLSGQELQDAIKGVATRRFRRRIAGFAQFRTGVQGFSKNIDRVLRSHIGEAVRYVQMDKLKFQAITTMESMGLSPARRENQETQVLQAAINAWFRDVNGQKQPTERAVDQWLDRLETTPAALPLLAGGTIAAALGIAGSPVLGPLLGSYIGYRLYRGITQGGEFKSRSITGAMLSDMAHLKLGAFLNVFSAAVNLSQLALATYPKLGEKWAMVGITRAAAALSAARLGKDSADAKLLERADIDPKFAATEASPHLFQKQSSAAKWSMFLFSGAETVNRASTFLGAYHRAVDRGASPAAAMAEAKRIVTETQFHYGAANKPELLRNTFLRVPLQFKNFAVQMFSFMFGLRGAEVARFALALLLVAGLFGIPGAEWLDWLIEAITGFSVKREIMRQGLLAQHAGEAYGNIIDFLARGFPAVLGVDLSARTGMGDLLPNEGRDFLGPWVGTIVQALRLGQQNSTLVDQVRNLSPGAGNPLKALEAAADGIPLELALARAAGLADGPTGFGNDRALMTNPWKRGFFDYEPTTGELWLSAMGGRPKRASDIQGYEQIKLKDTEELRKNEAKYLDRITRALRAAGGDVNSPAFKADMEKVLADAAADKRVSISREQVRNTVRNAIQDRGDRGMRSTPRELRPEMLKLRRGAYGEPVAPLSRPDVGVGTPSVVSP